MSQPLLFENISFSKQARRFKVLLVCATLRVKKGGKLTMSERIIYADRPFRDEFIEEIHTIAPGYIFKQNYNQRIYKM